MPPSPNPTSSPTAKSEAVTQGESILAGKSIGVDDLVKLVDRLKRERAFGLARKLLDRYAATPEVLWYSEWPATQRMRPDRLARRVRIFQYRSAFFMERCWLQTVPVGKTEAVSSILRLHSPTSRH